jgi:hypothetical protein
MKSNKPLHAVGAIILFILLSAGGWWLLSGDKKADNASPSGPGSASAPAATESSTQAAGAEDPRVKQIGPTINGFVSVYYARHSGLTEKMMLNQLKPWVTQSFLEDFPPDLSPAGDPWFRRGDERVIARGTPEPFDLFEVPRTVTVDTRIAQSSSDETYTYTVTLVLIWKGKWQVKSFS